MKNWVFSILICLTSIVPGTSLADVFIGGHADIGVGFEPGATPGLHLHLHAEGGPIQLFGGGIAGPDEFEPGRFFIGVPGSSQGAGSQLSFLAPQGSPIWLLPAGVTPGKPRLGFGTEELGNNNNWNPLTWTFNSITRVSGQDSQFAVWGFDAGGNLDLKASSLTPTPTGNSWTQVADSHEHFNMAFTGDGVYEVSLTISGQNLGGGALAIPAGTYTDTATFRFATGSSIATVPEPSSLLLSGLAALGCVFHRRRSQA